jgi:PAS domain S-box-containing protein
MNTITHRLDPEFLATAISVARIGVCLIDDKGAFIEVNPAFCELTGFVRDELIGKSWTLAAPPEISAQSKRFLAAVLSDSSKIPSEWKMKRKNGALFDALVSFRPLECEGKRCAVLTFSDITPRIEAEQRLQESETRFRQIAENVREVLWVTDPAKSQMLYVSPAYERVWGRTVESLHRDPLSFVQAIHADDRARVVAAFARQADGGYDEVYRVVRPDGSVRWIRDRAFPVKDAAGKAYRITGVATDITDIKLAEEESQRLQSDLERRIRERTEQIRRNRDVLLELAALDKSDRSRALAAILAADARTLDVERVSFWRLEPGGVAITCELLHARSRGGLQDDFAGTRLAAADYPTYFAAVLQNRPVVAHDAQSDSATREFADGYLKPLGITSMLDVPVWSQGKAVGVICHEHIGPAREWTGEEIDFASSIGNMVSLALEESRWQEAMDALTRSEEKYRQVVENANEAIAVVQDGRIRFANPQCSRLSGYSLQELAAGSFVDFIHGDDRQLVGANYAKRLRGEPAEPSYEFRIITKEGLTRWIHINAVMLEWDGRPATLNFLSDITPMQELQEHLRHSLAEREVVLRSTLVGITFSINRKHLWVNETFARMLGYDAAELVGQLSLAHFPDNESYVNFGNVAYPVLASGRAYAAEHQQKRKDGSLIWCQIYGNAVDPFDLSKGTIWTFLDVTERRELQETLRRSLMEREIILKSALVGISFAANRCHMWVNDTFARMLGYEKDELMGHSSLLHFIDRESWDAFGAEAYPILASGRPFLTERQFKRKDGSLFWCQVSGNAVDPNDLSKGTIWTNVDITERKRADEEIRKALEKERELNELKSRFVAMTSHEFRTPLATILSSAELLEHYGARLPPEEQKDLHLSVRTAVERMTKMLDNVLIIGRAEAQMLEFKPAPTDLPGFCEDLVEEMQLSAGTRHRLEYSFEGVRRPVKVDEKLLRHVLVNLISNAIKYSPQGGAVEFRVRLADGEATFEITDSGIGIPQEDQARLFETFHRARNVGNISGTGLGLAIVRKSLDLHGGTIRFESAPGQGTRFHVAIRTGS